MDNSKQTVECEVPGRVEYGLEFNMQFNGRIPMILEYSNSEN